MVNFNNCWCSGYLNKFGTKWCKMTHPTWMVSLHYLVKCIRYVYAKYLYKNWHLRFTFIKRNKSNFNASCQLNLWIVTGYSKCSKCPRLAWTQALSLRRNWSISSSMMLCWMPDHNLWSDANSLSKFDLQYWIPW